MSKHEEILNHAEAFVRRRGFDAFSFADLAAAVGIKKASVHYHFATKGALAAEMIERYTQAMAARLEELAEQDAGSAQRGFVSIYRDALGAGDEICLCAAMTATQSNLSEPAQAKLAAFYDLVLTWLHRKLGSRTEAMALLALVEGAQLMARAHADGNAFDAAVAPFLTRLSPQ